MSDYFEYYNEDNNKKEEEPVPKKKRGAAKKIFGTIGLAVIFGITASLVFCVTNSIIGDHIREIPGATVENTVEPEPRKPEQIETTETLDEATKDSKLQGDVAKPKGKNAENLFGFEREDKGYTVAEVVKECMPSIVAITNKSVQELRSMYGMEIRQFESESAGSGIIIGQNDTELLIVTNAHVVNNANTLTVKCIDDEVYEAKVKGTDDINDIAVIAVNLSDVSGGTLDAIKIATIGSSKDLEIGEQVVAIGNAMGYGQSVTTGIVSALDRTIDGSGDGNFYIQTDAAINPGNSGGALLDMNGKLVGINSAKLANTKIEGMGYAIPIDVASTIVDDLMTLVTREKVDEADAGYLGISGFSVTDEVASAYGIPKGIYVSEVTPGTAADNAGIQKGDVIISFEGMNMDSIKKLRERLDYYRAGEEVKLTIARADEGEYKEKELKAILDRRETTSKEAPEKDKSTESDDNNAAPEGDDNSQRSGEFNIGGNNFRYSVPNNLFDVFGW